MKRCLSFLLFIVLLNSCGEKEHRIDLLTENGKEIIFELAAEEVVNLYAEIEIEYKVKPDFVYHCSFRKDDVLMFEGGVDPLVTTANTLDSLTVKDGITHWSFYGKLEGNLTAMTYGVYSIKTTFIKNKQEDLKIIKANIVFTK
jgi:hypothetical protein